MFNADDEDRVQMIAHLIEQGFAIYDKKGKNIHANEYREYVFQFVDGGCVIHHDSCKAARDFLGLE